MTRWNRIPFTDDYEASRDGRIRSLKFGKQKILIPTLGRGYYQLHLYNKGKRRLWHVHRLIALTFLKNPNNLPEVNHKNGIKTDNRMRNLEWISKADHEKDRVLKGQKAFGESCNFSKLTEKQIIEIRKRYVFGKYGCKRLAKEFQTTFTNIHNIVTRKTWKRTK